MTFNILICIILRAFISAEIFILYDRNKTGHFVKYQGE